MASVAFRAAADLYSSNRQIALEVRESFINHQSNLSPDLSTIQQMCHAPTVAAQEIESQTGIPKYKQILLKLRRSISEGEYKPGDRMPSEADFVARFAVSRLTIQRVLKELQVEGLVERKVGSGTFVKPRTDEGKLFGLLIPGLGETEIFEPICQGIAKAGHRGGHALLWGDAGQGIAEQEGQALIACADYVARGVAGVFFAPMEGVEGKDRLN